MIRISTAVVIGLLVSTTNVNTTFAADKSGWLAKRWDGEGINFQCFKDGRRGNDAECPSKEPVDTHNHTVCWPNDHNENEYAVHACEDANK